MSDAVEEFVKQWLVKAQEDWDTVKILAAQDRVPAGVACFHCQQSVEKLIKAVLTRHSVEFPKTHDIRRLIELAGDLVPGLEELAPLAQKLTVHGVDTRCPVELKMVGVGEMKEIMGIADRCRQVILRAI
ncbi:MAG: HEPN domain-containing protein [Planctomycetota bacterium]|jgi:HEPN domain-containing protein